MTNTVPPRETEDTEATEAPLASVASQDPALEYRDVAEVAKIMRQIPPTIRAKLKAGLFPGAIRLRGSGEYRIPLRDVLKELSRRHTERRAGS